MAVHGWPVIRGGGFYLYGDYYSFVRCSFSYKSVLEEYNPGLTPSRTCTDFGAWGRERGMPARTHHQVGMSLTFMKYYCRWYFGVTVLVISPPPPLSLASLGPPYIVEYGHIRYRMGVHRSSCLSCLHSFNKIYYHVRERFCNPRSIHDSISLSPAIRLIYCRITVNASAVSPHPKTMLVFLILITFRLAFLTQCSTLHRHCKPCAAAYS